ncbi:MAG: ribosome small subunit-dependent GTPase A [Sphaerochaetaceae bacterium]|jgi:ribosome biogenesis GTPase
MRENVGLIIRGINNIFSVVPIENLPNIEQSLTCRIKGKILNNEEQEYNPLAVGDLVVYNEDHLIIERKERRNSFQRYNSKGQSNQTLVANVDLTILVASKNQPPFRARFLDRALVCNDGSDILILLNKEDLKFSKAAEKRFDYYEELGYETLKIEAFNSKGIEKLKQRISNLTVAFIGQSGVGKSTIINQLLGDDEIQKVGKVSKKYQKGRHTTRYSLMLQNDDFLLIDTPGMRELHIPTTDLYTLSTKFVEFEKYASGCAFQRCLHLEEPNCKVKEALKNKLIDSDRYLSYTRMVDSLKRRPILY